MLWWGSVSSCVSVTDLLVLRQAVVVGGSAARLGRRRRTGEGGAGRR